MCLLVFVFSQKIEFHIAQALASYSLPLMVFNPPPDWLLNRRPTGKPFCNSIWSQWSNDKFGPRYCYQYQSVGWTSFEPGRNTHLTSPRNVPLKRVPHTRQTPLFDLCFIPAEYQQLACVCDGGLEHCVSMETVQTSRELTENLTTITF